MRDLDEDGIVDIIGEILSKVLDIPSTTKQYKIYVDKRELLQMILSDTKRIIPILIETIHKDNQLDDTIDFGKINISKKTYEPKLTNLRDTKFDTKYFRQFKQIDVILTDPNPPKRTKFNIFCDLIEFAIEIIDNL